MIGTTEAAYLLGICCQRVRQLLKAGRIEGAVKVGRFWQIPLFNGIPKVKETSRTRNSNWRRRLQSATTIIHVNRQNIDINTSEGTNLPAIIVHQGKIDTTCHSAVIHGPSRIVYRPHQPKSGGARLWIEAEPHVQVQTLIFA